jgi:hypothetical protein
LPELLIRPSLGDHKVLADLLAPSPVGRPIDRVVFNAQDVVRSQDLLETAKQAGTPILIDPLTMLLQTETDPNDPWARHVPYGQAEALPPAMLSTPFIMDELIAQAVEFQAEHGATAIIAPYFYADGPGSPAFAASMAAIGRTARRMRNDGITLRDAVRKAARVRASPGLAGRA